MNNQLVQVGRELKSMESGAAAAYLIDNFPVSSPNYWFVFDLLKSRSWKRSDQVRLARYYLQKAPFADARPYEVFASFMSVELFMEVVRAVMPRGKSDIDLFVYHLKPVLLRMAKTGKDVGKVEALLIELASFGES
jgi:hypothetical protein